MEQHPVPQNISSYEFRLVGDMTLKQFFQLAGGALVAFILFKTNLPFIIKWPMVFLSAMTGVLLAFVPINGRPFSQWVMAFIKAIYSPTEFFWSPVAVVPEAELPTESEITKPKSPLDRFEEQMFSRFSQLFNGQTPEIPLTVTPAVSLPTQPTSITTTMTPVAHLPEVDVPPAPRATQTMISKMETVAPPVSPTAPAPVVSTAPIAVSTPTPSITPQTVINIPTPKPTMVPVLDRSLKTEALTADLANLPLPEQPNILVGQIVNATRQSIEGVIVEIAESQSGLPVRALRTNKLGQFQIATPLPVGQYIIQAEKEGIVFDPISILADNKIISPILITARA